METSYSRRRQIGERFERYVVGRLQKEGVAIHRHEDRWDQLNLGDTSIGIEIKFDQLHHKTGNLYIEIIDRRTQADRYWVPAGIRSRSSARWYGIGDYRNWYVFRRSDLQREQDYKRYRVFEIPAGTSRGFLLPPTKITELAVRTRHWPDMNPLGTAAVGVEKVSA